MIEKLLRIARGYKNYILSPKGRFEWKSYIQFFILYILVVLSIIGVMHYG